MGDGPRSLAGTGRQSPLGTFDIFLVWREHDLVFRRPGEQTACLVHPVRVVMSLRSSAFCSEVLVRHAASSIESIRTVLANYRTCLSSVLACFRTSILTVQRTAYADRWRNEYKSSIKRVIVHRSGRKGKPCKGLYSLLRS